MTIAVFGGSFDPPHIAHLFCVHYVLSVFEVDKVVIVPVFHHAFEKELSPYEIRVEMCEAAFRGEDRVFVSRIESTLPTPNYTLNTLQALMKEYPKEEFRLVIGADLLLETKNWHRFDEVTKLAHPLIVGRKGFDSSMAPQALLPEISSSDARTWFRASPSAEDRENQLLKIPRAVREVIERARLYQSIE